MDYKIIEIHCVYDNSKLKEVAVLWEANEYGAVRATYCDNKPKSGYEYLLPEETISPKLIQKVAGYGMDLTEEKKKNYFSGYTNWDR